MQPRPGGFQFLSLCAALLGVVVTPAGRWDDHDPTVHSPAIPPDKLSIFGLFVQVCSPGCLCFRGRDGFGHGYGVGQAHPLKPTCVLGLVHAICGAAVSPEPGHSAKGGLECRDDHLLRTHIPFPVVWGIPSSLYSWLVSNPMPRSILAYYTPPFAHFCHPFQLSLYQYT
ncbi:Uncharacterized protein HZ326_18469 [Fusarium oxysporum f. sp. albedinis]|nr:Uncharacterized protein HZ326_18469 [Fusarium oxysporum f. sp. albedinis]